MLIKVSESLPLIGHIAFGIIDRGTNIIQVRPFSGCPMSCIFCSVDAGKYTKTRANEFIVESKHIIYWFNYVAEIKSKPIIALIDGVGEPIMHPQISTIIAGIKKNPKVKKVQIETHGLILRRELIDLLYQSGLDTINLSIDTLNTEKAKVINGHPGINIDRILDAVLYAKSLGIEVNFVPVWLKGINDKDMEELIAWAKEHEIKIWIQKYIKHKYGRKSNIPSPSWNEWRRFLEQLQEKFKVNLFPYLEAEEDISETPRLKVGEKVFAKVVLPGWRFGEKIAIAKERLISVKTNAPIGAEIKIKIIRNKHQIYLGRVNP